MPTAAPAPKVGMKHKMNNEENMKGLLASKIAELQIGDMETTAEVPVDVSGMYSDDNIGKNFETQWNRLIESPTTDIKQLNSLFYKQTKALEAMQRKVTECHAKYVMGQERKNFATKELQKAVGKSGKLEELCRELQKQNKKIMGDSARVIEEADKKREELSGHFKKNIDDIGVKMEEQNKNYLDALKENQELRESLKKVLEQYDVREKHFENQLHSKDLTVQLAEAKHEQQVHMNKESNEKIELLLKKATVQAEREQQLLEQLNKYGENLTNANETFKQDRELFQQFKAEQKKLTKIVSTLQSENAALKKKCKEYDEGALSILQDSVRKSDQVPKLEKKIQALQQLCRTLKTERDDLLVKLN